MSHSSRVAVSALRSSAKLALLSSVLIAAACASRSAEPPPATAAAPEAPAAALSQASTGIAEQQASPDDIVFVERERKEATPQDNAAPATSLRAQPAAGRQRMGHIESTQ